LEDIEKELITLEQESSCDHSIELMIRQTYDRCCDCEKFFELNLFAILKTIKKLNKLAQSSLDGNCYISASKEFVDENFTQHILKASCLKSKCIELYSSKFCRNYPTLGTGELKFVKNKERVNPQTPFHLSFKFGISAAVIMLMLADLYLGNDKMGENRFWNYPGLYVYTTVGNLLVFRITWATNLIMWNKFGINYIPIFQFPDNKPNMMIVIDHISTQMLLFSVNVLLFYEAHKPTSTLLHLNFFRNGLPVLLVLFFIVYEAWEYYLFGNTYRLSRGLFSIQSLKNCSMTPFVKVTFRDNYVANTLTSFTKAFADFFHACCWIVCGGFLFRGGLAEQQTVDHFGNGSHISCTSMKMNIVIMAFQLIPQWMRFGQNLRQYQDTKLSRYPWNMLKYLLTMSVILYGFFHDRYDYSYIILVAGVALYKWWWDVVMNWGLFDPATLQCWTIQETANTNENKNENSPSPIGNDKPMLVFGLRKQLMFPYPLLYYACIVGNLVLRFLWVISLLPPNVSRVFVGSKLEFFLASMELLRRAMWGLLKTEYEHIRNVEAKKPGYYFPRRVEQSLYFRRKQENQLHPVFTEPEDNIESQFTAENSNIRNAVEYGLTPNESRLLEESSSSLKTNRDKQVNGNEDAKFEEFLLHDFGSDDSQSACGVEAIDEKENENGNDDSSTLLKENPKDK
jgi:hypothetical protein